MLRRKPDPFRQPPIELTPALAARFRELDTPTDTDMACTCCGQGRDVPKTTIRNRPICVVCSAMLGQMSKFEREKVWGCPDFVEGRNSQVTAGICSNIIGER
jgi:hypothetical protein